MTCFAVAHGKLPENNLYIQLHFGFNPNFNFILLNEVASLENCLNLQGFPIRKDPRKGLLNFPPRL